MEWVSELRLPSGTDVKAKGHRRFSDPEAFTFEGVKGHIYAAAGLSIRHMQQRGAILFVDLESAETDTAFFVDRAGRTTVLTRVDSRAEFARHAGVLAVRSAAYTGVLDDDGEEWVDGAGDGNQIANGVVERVEPQWYW